MALQSRTAKKNKNRHACIVFNHTAGSDLRASKALSIFPAAFPQSVVSLGALWRRKPGDGNLSVYCPTNTNTEFVQRPCAISLHCKNLVDCVRAQHNFVGHCSIAYKK